MVMFVSLFVVLGSKECLSVCLFLDGDTNSIHVVGKEEQQEETDRCQDSQVQQVESREKQLRQKSVEISKQLEQLEHNDQNEVMKKNLEGR